MLCLGPFSTPPILSHNVHFSHSSLAPSPSQTTVAALITAPPGSRLRAVLEVDHLYINNDNHTWGAVFTASFIHLDYLAPPQAAQDPFD
jgi:hypothetical protein